jgi:hypothetical protein
VKRAKPEVQESIRRWWALIHPADRPIAQKYLLLVLGRSASALDSMGDAFLSVSTCEVPRPHDDRSPLPGKRMRLLERMVKESSVRTAFNPATTRASRTQNLHFPCCVLHRFTRIFSLIP